MVDAGIDLDSVDKQGNCGLHVLLRSRSISELLSTVQLLCSKGAHSDRRNENGLSPLQLIAEQSSDLVNSVQRKMGPDRLKCFCARKIVSVNLDCDQLMSDQLIHFLRIH